MVGATVTLVIVIAILDGPRLVSCLLDRNAYRVCLADSLPASQTAVTLPPTPLNRSNPPPALDASVPGDLPRPADPPVEEAAPDMAASPALEPLVPSDRLSALPAEAPPSAETEPLVEIVPQADTVPPAEAPAAEVLAPADGPEPMESAPVEALPLSSADAEHVADPGAIEQSQLAPGRPPLPEPAPVPSLGAAPVAPLPRSAPLPALTDAPRSPLGSAPVESAPAGKPPVSDLRPAPVEVARPSAPEPVTQNAPNALAGVDAPILAPVPAGRRPVSPRPESLPPSPLPEPAVSGAPPELPVEEPDTEPAAGAAIAPADADALPGQSGAQQQGSASAEPDVEPDMEPPEPRSEMPTVTVRRGDTLWAIARRAYGRGIRYWWIVEANPDEIRDPDVIWPGQVLRVPPARDD